jgi:succinoglycan biosynthesis transport protein ExoP
VKRLEELDLLKDYGGYKTAVISPPAIGNRISPLFAKSLLLGALFGAGIGLALSYAAESSDTTFRTPQEVSEFLRLPVIGHIPVISQGSHEVRSNSKLDATLITYFKPKSRQSEAYRAIRTSLYFSTRAEQHKVIQISSPNPGDGKTTLSGNLAISIAQSGKKVLLIDADFRRPRIHALFGLDKSVGMSSVIGGEVELPDAIQETEVENLWGLPCGPRPNNPCELLTSPRFEELLAILRDKYDFVIVDTPPILPVTDPGAVAPRVDGVILTIRLTNRARGAALRAVQLLAELGGNTLGVVVNGVGKNSPRGYGYNYGYGYESYDFGGDDSRFNLKYGYDNTDNNPYFADDEGDSEKPAPRLRESRQI